MLEVTNSELTKSYYNECKNDSEKVLKLLITKVRKEGVEKLLNDWKNGKDLFYKSLKGEEENDDMKELISTFEKTEDRCRNVT